MVDHQPDFCCDGPALSAPDGPEIADPVQAHRQQLEELVRMKDQCIRQKQSEERTYEQATLELKRQKRAMYLEMEHGCQLQLQLSVHKQHLAAANSDIECLTGERDQNRLYKSEVRAKMAAQNALNATLLRVDSALQDLQQEALSHRSDTARLFDEVNAEKMRKQKQLIDHSNQVQAANRKLICDNEVIAAEIDKQISFRKDIDDSIRQVTSAVNARQQELQNLKKMWQTNTRANQANQEFESKHSQLELEKEVTRLKRKCQELETRINASEQGLLQLTDMVRWIQ